MKKRTKLISQFCEGLCRTFFFCIHNERAAGAAFLREGAQYRKYPAAQKIALHRRLCDLFGNDRRIGGSFGRGDHKCERSPGEALPLFRNAGEGVFAYPRTFLHRL